VALGALFGALGLGTVAGLIGLISFAIPGLHLFAATGRMATILTFAAAGAAAGVIAGGLIGLRTPDHLTKQREIDKRADRTLITVHAETKEASERAMTILRSGGAEEVPDASASAGPRCADFWRAICTAEPWSAP
jgi:hypothetical protein